MLDEKTGMYLGVPECRSYVAIERVDDRLCCHNTVMKVAFIKCSARGIVEGQIECNRKCGEFVEDFAKKRR